MKTAGLILAGGLGKRIGGEKPLKTLSGKPLLYWALRAFLPLNLPILISVRDEGQREVLERALEGSLDTLINLQFVLDDKNFRGLGPLSGLLAGLNFAERDTLLVVSAVDQPLLKEELLKFLATEGKKLKTPALVFKRGEALEPLPGAYTTALLPEIEGFLQVSPRKSFKAFLKELQKKGLLATSDFWHKIDPEGESFVNINDTAELSSIERCFFRKRT